MGTHTIPYLQLFPSEIWSACWTHCSTRQLRRLSLVCQRFHALCLPLLFRSQTFNASSIDHGVTVENWMERLHWLHRTALRLEKITEGPRRLMVHFWRFRAEFRLIAPLHKTFPNIVHMPMVDSMYERVFASFCTTLRLYQHLHCLDLSQVTIDHAIRDSLSALPMLENLKLSECDIVAREGSLIGLKSFIIMELGRRKESEPLRLASAKHLRTLRIHSKDVPSILAGFGSEKLPQLLTLSLEVLSAPSNPGVTQFFAFLKQCEGLETLMVPMRYFNTATLFSASWDSDTIPRLRCLTAPLGLIPIFTLNRPVTSVTILHHQPITSEILLQLLGEIAQTSVPVQSLTFPRATPSGEAIDTITSLFPELWELSIELYEKPAMPNICSGRYAPNTPSPIDDRVPELCDETAFDDLPDEDVSDTEEEENAPPAPVLIERSAHQEFTASPNLQNVLNWICGNLHPLPADIELLHLLVPTKICPELSLSDEHKAVASLASLYPRLREVRLGSTKNHWDRNGVVWKRREAAEYIQVQ
ncbi:hypothetical protein C8R43DRAFT_984424 [Mycena crocata]|nr:hypothetical protein C8R43DRAFT_984424 [Mycena crocata]